MSRVDISILTGVKIEILNLIVSIPASSVLTFSDSKSVFGVSRYW